MAELLQKWKENKLFKVIFAVTGIMSTLVIYGVLQEKIMRVPYGPHKEYFKYSLFLVFCNRIATSAVSAAVLLASGKALDAVAPLYKYGIISVSNILTTTCQYEALKYVSFPVQTLAKCAKMIPVMIWGTVIMQKKYNSRDYLLAFLVTLGCSLFILYPAAGDISPYNRGRESTVWGVSLMLGYLGFDGFTSTFQDKLFRGYDMEIQNQIFYTTLCSCILSFTVLEIEKLKEEASEETRKHKEHVKQLLHLLSITTQERDEARNQLQKLLNNSILTSSTESLNILPQFYVENPILIPTNANSGITESNSLSTLSETYNYTSCVSSPVDSFFDAVSSPDVSNFNVLSANQFGPSVQMIDRASLIIDNLAKDRVLPQNGKFLQAVIEAGQSGLMAGPLPMWRNPPRVQAFQIPPVPMKGYDHEAFA